MTNNNDDFFADETGVKQEVKDTVKIGEKEYSQDDLNKLVGLGERAQELEDKWNTKIDRLYPEYTKKSQKLSEYEEKLKTLEEEKTKVEQERLTRQSQDSQLSPEDQAKLIKQELKKYGAVTVDEINQYVANFMAGKELLDEVGNIVNEAKSDGKPTATKEELLAYMDENGIKNPKAAYKLMFEDELREWEQKQISKIKKPGLVTDEASTAGSKSPAPVKVTKENLQALLAAAMEE